MLRSTGVVVTLIICGSVVTLGLLGIIGWLLYAGRDTAAILTLVNSLIAAVTYMKLRDVDSRTTRVEQNVNGNTTRLMDAALRTKQEESL